MWDHKKGILSSLE